MLSTPLHRESSIVFVMKLLQNLMDEEIIETDVFYWNPLGEQEDYPNFWHKETSIEIEWHKDDPGRGAFTNLESEDTTEVALYLLDTVKESYYAIVSRGKEVKS